MGWKSVLISSEVILSKYASTGSLQVLLKVSLYSPGNGWLDRDGNIIIQIEETWKILSDFIFLINLLFGDFRLSFHPKDLVKIKYYRCQLVKSM